MAYDEDLADRIRVQLSGVPVTEKKMFGGLAFLVGGNMAVAASGQGGLLVRVDPDETDRLLGEPGTALMEMGGRGPMKGWLRVRDDAVGDDAALAAWVRRGVDFAGSLPTK
jgi:TfoX/Sxy family transcriptional regulator of competence genes